LSEEQEIKRMGARAQRNSGRGLLEKGDAVLGDFLVDIKEYDESFSVSRKNWAKLQKDAWSSMRRIPAFMLSLGSKSDPNKLRLWVISDAMFREMHEAWKEKYDQG
jgi:hypothetical protein